MKLKARKHSHAMAENAELDREFATTNTDNSQQKVSQNTQKTQNVMKLKARKHSHAMAEDAELDRCLATTNTTRHTTEGLAEYTEYAKCLM